MIDFLVSNADKSAYLAGVAWILGFIALFLFFAVGGVWGPINDAFTVFQCLFLVPVALALHRILTDYVPLVSLGAAATGIASMLLIAVLQALLVFGYVRFEQTLRPILSLGAVLGLWWLVVSVLSLAHAALPAGLAWVGVAVGLGYVLTAIGFWFGGQRHPLAATGFVVLAVGGPIWCFWLGSVLALAGGAT